MEPLSVVTANGCTGVNASVIGSALLEPATFLSSSASTLFGIAGLAAQ